MKPPAPCPVSAPALPATSERPRERMLRHGARVLTTPELLAIILRTGVAGCGAVSLAHQLLHRFGSLGALLAADAPSLMGVRGMGAAKVCELQAVGELGRRVLEEDLKTGVALDSPDRVSQYCRMHLGHLPIEHCMALYLDSQFRLIATEEVARGTLSQASVYPREVVKAALRHHAAALILAHNHPSGVAQPSPADVAFTRHLKTALALVDVRLLDHLVVTRSAAQSLAEEGLI